MANELTRVFGADKTQLAKANEKNGSTPSVGTTFNLTGNVAVEAGWLDRQGNRHNDDRFYAFFEGKRNGNAVANGINASIFLRRPFNGFTEEEQAQLNPFTAELTQCLDAGDLDAVFQKYGVYTGKTVKVASLIRHMEVPYGQDKERPVRYANFIVE